MQSTTLCSVASAANSGFPMQMTGQNLRLGESQWLTPRTATSLVATWRRRGRLVDLDDRRGGHHAGCIDPRLRLNVCRPPVAWGHFDVSSASVMDHLYGDASRVAIMRR